MTYLPKWNCDTHARYIVNVIKDSFHLVLFQFYEYIIHPFIKHLTASRIYNIFKDSQKNARTRIIPEVAYASLYAFLFKYIVSIPRSYESEPSYLWSEHTLINAYD